MMCRVRIATEVGQLLERGRQHQPAVLPDAHAAEFVSGQVLREREPVRGNPAHFLPVKNPRAGLRDVSTGAAPSDRLPPAHTRRQRGRDLPSCLKIPPISSRSVTAWVAGMARPARRGTV